VAPRNPVLAALGSADQAALRFLRTRGHSEPIETLMRGLGLAGEFAAAWAVIGAIGASIYERRRGQWLAAAATGPAAVGINFVVKVTVGRERPLIEEHPPLARAPTKLSFPSAHATSSVAGATALGRVEPRARPVLFALAAAICVGRPYLGMHYPSDVLAGAALGAVLGSLAPRLGPPRWEQRPFDLERGSNRGAGVDGGPDSAWAPVDPAAETA
jgi:hypothetical protein